METRVKRGIIKKKIYALLTVIIIIANLFSPYSILTNKTYASQRVERRTIHEIKNSWNRRFFCGGS